MKFRNLCPFFWADRKVSDVYIKYFYPWGPHLPVFSNVDLPKLSYLIHGVLIRVIEKMGKLEISTQAQPKVNSWGPHTGNWENEDISYPSSKVNSWGPHTGNWENEDITQALKLIIRY